MQNDNVDTTDCKERVKGGILLEVANEGDVSGVLHLRGSMLDKHGIIYFPACFFSSKEDSASSATPFLWYRSVLQQTLNSDPVLHCHGLHEWAMQYHPLGADPPPSAKYQSQLPLRISRSVINEAVERRGISCTHVDALRYFSPAALDFFDMAEDTIAMCATFGVMPSLRSCVLLLLLSARGKTKKAFPPPV
jgi:hypothetical protein